VSDQPDEPLAELESLRRWFPHITELGDMDLAFLLQSFVELRLAARQAGALLVDDFLTRWLLILEGVMQAKGYATVGDLRKALAARVMPPVKPDGERTVN
jgi:hypothetical protein